MPSKTIDIELPIQFPFEELKKSSPDIFAQNNAGISHPDDNYIISKNINGDILSRYGDPCIDLTPYSTTQGTKSKFHFNQIKGDTYQKEARWLWFICYRFGKGKNKNNLSVGVLYSRYIGVIKPLCEFAKLDNVSTIHVLETEKLLTKFIYENNGAIFNQQIIPVLKLYHSLSTQIGFNVALKSEQLSMIEKRNNEAKTNRKQTEIIPPRLYGSWLNEAWKAVSEFEKNVSGITNILREIVKEISDHPEKYTTEMREVNWNYWIKENKLTEFSIAREFLNKRKKFSSYLSDFMLICKGLIHFYSGMRDDEVLSLNYHCLIIDEVNNRKKARLLGNTTKYIGNKKQERWVTTYEIERVISALQSIVQPISSLTDVSIKSNLSKGEFPCPLFLTPNYLYYDKFREKHPHGIARSWRITETNSLSNNSLIDKKVMTITEEDIKYLEQFDPERNWRQSKYAVGEIWHLKTHQFRRSLAVYSAQSGLVSIGSLQAQLKHLCQEVTFYYGNGAERAGKIFDIKSNNHMAHQFLKEKPLADYTAWVWQILFSDETLDGINGRVIERTTKGNTPERRTLILQDRKKTIKQFKDGQRAYAETPLGGCETETPCDKKLMHSITACIICNKADLKPSKVKRTIDSMTIFVESLPPDSVEYRTELDELNKLIAVNTRMEAS
jgi:hypothetical protein